MCVAVDQNIPLLKWRQIVFIIDMSVGSIKSSAIQVKNAVICHYRELEHHLIYFSLTVASYCIDFFLHIIQHGNDFLGCVFFRKVISGSMIKQITQQYQAVCFFFFIGIQHFSAIISRAMYI